MIQNKDGTLTMSPYDLIGILKDTSTGRFHACLWLDSPPSSASLEDISVRLKSKFHHTIGAETLEEAQEHVAMMHQRFPVRDHNVWKDETRVVSRDFKEEGFASILWLPKFLLDPPVNPQPSPPVSK